VSDVKQKSQLALCHLEGDQIFSESLIMAQDERWRRA
jgi:hypothetical protein